MNQPIRTTIIFALISGLLYLPLSWGWGSHLPYRPVLHFGLWIQLAIYAVLLARWSRTRLISILFPLLMLLVVTLLPGPHIGFVILSLGILSWIRSGICFTGTPLRSLMAELVTVLGGLALYVLLAGPSILSWSLGLTLFGLVQSLYFFIIPMAPEEPTQRIPQDPFELAFLEAEKILGSNN